MQNVAEPTRAVSAIPGIVDVGQNGIGVAPLPLEQRTQLGAFGAKPPA